MNLIEDLKNRAVQFKKDLDSGLIMQNIIFENDAYIIDMNTEQLSEQGINRLGVSIMDYAPYSPLTIQIKEMKGQPTDRVTLRDTGDFQSSFYLDVQDKQFEIKAEDWKTEDLIIKYGRQILGLTDENILIFIQEYIYPDLLNEAKKRLYGKK